MKWLKAQKRKKSQAQNKTQQRPCARLAGHSDYRFVGQALRNWSADLPDSELLTPNLQFAEFTGSRLHPHHFTLI
ncbi:hypothetical protein NBRC116585_16800 [Thalassolituus maritimus]|uniref:Uncharacterized protein n=1 Tax=Thalassolituus maritimus TaxID=484498 RepID=A0ABP9ZZJ0_9GAMM